MLPRNGSSYCKMDSVFDDPIESSSDTALNYNRELVVHSQMKKLEHKYVDIRDFRVFIGSWNVNGQSVSTSLGEHWLSCDPNPPDVYAVGFQELDLSKEAFLFNDTPKEEEWLRAVTLSLHPKANYVKVKLIRLIGMMLVVFVKRDLMDYIANVSACTVGTGILGKMGNKGGVAIRFDLHCTSVCFVNSHLAAHQEECERRNQDFHDICNRIVFNHNGEDIYIKDHDHIYWFGDLNYRINDLSSDQVKVQIETGRFEPLMEHDQLKQQQSLRKAFVDFQEAPIRYQPTYKYDPGTDQWDSSEKNRPPAWCDRILWSGSEPIKCLTYRSHAQLRLSDHKPVSALFSASIKVVNAEKHRKTYEEVIKHLDRCENDSLPQVTVSTMELDFGNVRFRDQITRTLVIENTGLVTVRFEFINKPGHSSYCKPFIQIKPHCGTIEIGKKVQVQFEMFVTEQNVGGLNTQQELIDEILVLHLDRGKDIFITISGKYEPSSFGSSIETLIRLRDSVREYGVDNFVQLLRNHYRFTHDHVSPSIDCNVSLIQLECAETTSSSGNQLTNYDLQPCWDIPKEIWLLVHFLFKFGLDQEDIFIQPGLKSEFERIRDAVDTCKNEDLDVSIHSIAEALLIFLESLSESVVPFSFYQKAVDSVKNFALCKQVINEIPESHRKVFYYIISFMKELLKHSKFNKLESSVLDLPKKHNQKKRFLCLNLDHK